MLSSIITGAVIMLVGVMAGWGARSAAYKQGIKR